MYNVMLQRLGLRKLSPTYAPPFGKRWGGDAFTLTAEHLAALHAGKAIALDVMNEHLTFVVLEKPKNDQ